MLSFKEYLKEIYLAEATAKHFPHIELNPENPEHKDLIDAYNSGLSSKSEIKLPKPGQFKSIDQLKTAVQPQLAKIQTKRQEDTDDKRAFESGEATLIHHNPETGVKVIKVTSQAGSCAGGAPDTWCTGKRGAVNDMVKQYDPEGTHSFIFHFPKDPNKNLRTIGAYGEYKEGSANFQGINNASVPLSNWNNKIREHGLDKIKLLKGVVRGIGITDNEKNRYGKELTNSIKGGILNPEDVSHAVANNYLTNEHKDALVDPKHNTSPSILHSLASDSSLHQKILRHPNANEFVLGAVARKTTDSEVHKAIVAHENTGADALISVARNTTDPKIQKAIVAHENANDLALGAVASRTTDTEIHKAIAAHENTEDGTLGDVARTTSDPEIHQKILKHPNVHNYALNAIARNTTDPEIQKAIVAKKYANDFVLGDVASRTTDNEVHKAIVAHPNVYNYALDTIARNTLNPEVSKAIEIKRKELFSK